MAKVYVGIGHGGSDPGACANGYREKDLTLSIGRACYDELKRCGVEAKISRTDDRDVTIAQRLRKATRSARITVWISTSTQAAATDVKSIIIIWAATPRSWRHRSKKH